MTATAAVPNHPRILRPVPREPARVEAARRAAEPFLGKIRTGAWKNYFIPLPDTAPPPRHEGYNWPYWTTIASEIRIEIEALSHGYVMTGDARFLARARRLMVSLAAWPVWTDPDACSNGRSPCLDTYLFTTGLAVGYDLLYSALPAEERAAIRRAIVEKGLRFLYSSTDDPESFAQRPSRWPNGYAMVAAALGIGSLAVLDEEPDAPRFLERAIEKTELFLEEEARPDGSLVEGFYYAAASMDPLCLFLSTLRRNTGVNLFTRPYFRHAHEFPMYFLVPGSNWLASFGDSGGPRGEQPMLLGTVGTLLGEGIGGRHAAWYLQQALKAAETEPDYLETIQRVFFHGVRKVSPARDLWRADVDALPAGRPDALPEARSFPSIGWVAMRTGWTADDSLLAFRAGPSVGHSHLDQNGFIIAAGGEVLASDPGYQRFNMKYPDHADPAATRRQHEFTRGSIGHNVILVDGEGQRNAAGTLTGFFESRAFAWAAGDAAAAYPSLRRFTRHIVHVKRPGYFLVFDDIRTDGTARRVDWLLQTQPQGRFDIGGSRVVIVSGGASLSGEFPLSQDLTWERRDYPESARFGKTIAARLQGAELRFAAAFQTGRPQFRFRAGGANRIDADSGAERDSIEFGPALTWTRRAASGEVIAWALMGGTELPGLVEASADVSISAAPGEIRVSAPAAVSIRCRTRPFTTIRDNGLRLGPNDYEYRDGTLELKLAAGQHRLGLEEQ